MKLLAVVPARSGSRRLPGKNLLLIGGKSLVARTLEVANDIPEICDVLLTTDSTEIADLGKGLGALVPWLRPHELASDTASSADVAIHALNWYESEKGKVDGLLLLQPTSPFRTRESVLKGIQLFLQSKGESVIGVSPCHFRLDWLYTIDSGHLSAMSPPLVEFHNKPIENGIFIPNGYFYLVNPTHLQRQRSFYSNATVPLVIESAVESLDIDTNLDYKFALYLNNV